MVRVLVLTLLLWAGSGFTQNVNCRPDSSRHENAVTGGDNWFGRDKFKHFFASAYLTGFGAALGQQVFDRDKQTGSRYGAIFGISMGLGKEMVDRYGRHQIFSWKDLAADALGVLFGLFLIGLWS